MIVVSDLSVVSFIRSKSARTRGSMKKKESFLVQIIREERTNSASFRGVVVQIRTGVSKYFETADELKKIILQFLVPNKEKK